MIAHCNTDCFRLHFHARLNSETGLSRRAGQCPSLLDSGKVRQRRVAFGKASRWHDGPHFAFFPCLLGPEQAWSAYLPSRPVLLLAQKGKQLVATAATRQTEATVARAEARERIDRGPGHLVEHSIQLRKCPGSPHNKAFQKVSKGTILI